MQTWLSSLLQVSDTAPRLGITVHRRGALVHQTQLTRNGRFTIGRSRRCSLQVCSSALKHERFVLVQNRGGAPQIHFTHEMGGALHHRGEHLTLSALRETSLVKVTPSGHCLKLGPDAAFHLCIDDMLIRFDWQVPASYIPPTTTIGIPAVC